METKLKLKEDRRHSKHDRNLIFQTKLKVDRKTAGLASFIVRVRGSFLSGQSRSKEQRGKEVISGVSDLDFQMV